MAKKRTPIVAGATVEEGPHVQWDNPKLSMAALKGWVGERITITIAQEEERRRVRQNNFYWKALEIVSRHERDEGVGRGWNKDEFHLHFALAYNSAVFTDLDMATGVVTEQRVGKSTATLSIADFSVYLDSVLMEIARDYGLVIEPKPHEDWRDREDAA